MKKYLGIDWGEVRIGTAGGDSASYLALPYKTVASVDEIGEIVRADGINEIVIGEPRSLSGRRSADRAYLRFVADIRARFNIPVHIVDERLSSAAADRLSGRAKQSADRDSVAAMLILQSYFDRHRNG